MFPEKIVLRGSTLKYERPAPLSSQYLRPTKQSDSKIVLCQLLFTSTPTAVTKQTSALEASGLMKSFTKSQPRVHLPTTNAVR